MIVVTGGAGFIGSNIVFGLNQKGYSNILVVDTLTKAKKFRNLLPLKFCDFQDKTNFIENIITDKFTNHRIEAVFHQGACSDTMEHDGKYMMQNNYEYSKVLLQFCLQKRVPFIYASSASVYGNGLRGFFEDEESEDALNIYAFSKLMFDRYVRSVMPCAQSQVVGLRYFNVYGPQENHKERMASIAYQLYRQLTDGHVARLFKGSDGYGDGEQKRDFVYVKDVVRVNLFFLQHPHQSGIFNCGTGRPRTFMAVAQTLISTLDRGELEYIDFPDSLRGKYQSFTHAQTDKLLGAGFDGSFMELEDALSEYVDILSNNDGYLA
ncbi:MAG TPA: ADP-glyceromanno-heptose 6-epimerase [Spirochaetia bacterium]|nr:ADP-glyceromanno-heptose 6-epimerase [Spirochaetia bacterium]